MIELLGDLVFIFVVVIVIGLIMLGVLLLVDAVRAWSRR